MAASLRYTVVMPYMKHHLLEASGLPDRTIRNYIARGLIPKPDGYGLAAEYGEEHMVRAVAIGRMRKEGAHIDAITERIAGWTTARFKRFVRDTDPPAPPPDPPAAQPFPVEPRAPSKPEPPRLPHQAEEGQLLEDRPARHAHLHRYQDIEEATLPPAPAWRIYPLLTGIALMVDTGAPPVVERIAAEILARYGQARAARD